ncbi:Metallo-beta-lactamase superfamily protein [uncultured delta proteobacterium]|uniref:Metallo-beta-lactamase superfamily protein n=1 Tax=uncultured delta proteobacterium TaxID=34034 RepID=A0A212JDY7_9DELT|nr:Metallo-beta-lactamase superfamily protein [uncultured delta proteobacterium]
MLHLSVLMENTAAEGFACEHGLSFLLDSGDTVILFDTGASGAFLDNAARMGLDLGNVTHIVLSHGHYDHTGGLGAGLAHIAAKKAGRELPPLLAHPAVVINRRRPLDHPKGPKDLGMPEDGRDALRSWPMTVSKDPVRIREDIVFLGEVPPARPEMRALVGEAECGGTYRADTLPDDTALAYITDEGLIIIAGCSHAGIVNIMEHAKAVTGVSKIRAVYGGLHCKDMTDDTIARTRAALEVENLAELYACHCTGSALDDFPVRVRLAAGESRKVF